MQSFPFTFCQSGLVILLIILYHFRIQIVSLAKYFSNYMSALGNFFKISLECPPKPKLQSATLKGLAQCSDSILVMTFLIITGQCLMTDAFIYPYLIIIEMSTSLPINIRYYLEQYKDKMRGNPSAISKFQQSVKQFNECRKQCMSLRKIQIYEYTDEKGLINNQLYLAKIEGRKNTYYQGRIISFYLFVYDTYPEDPPEIVVPYYYDIQNSVQKPFLHLNMDLNGHVCMLSNQKQKQYYKYTTLKDILIELQNMIYVPNISSSYPSELFSCYKQQGDNSEYFKKLNHQAKFLQPFDQSQSSSSSESDNDG